MLTPTQLAAKRKSRTLSSRAKSRARAARIGRHLEDQARAREASESWLSDLARQQSQKATYSPKAQVMPAPGAWARARAFLARLPVPRGVR